MIAITNVAVAIGQVLQSDWAIGVIWALLSKVISIGGLTLQKSSHNMESMCPETEGEEADEMPTDTDEVQFQNFDYERISFSSPVSPIIFAFQFFISNVFFRRQFCFLIQKSEIKLYAFRASGTLLVFNHCSTRFSPRINIEFLISFIFLVIKFSS